MKALLLLISFCAIASASEKFHDVSRIEEAVVSEIIQVHSESEILTAVERAKKKGLKVSVAGSRHSQGGQTFYPGGMVVDIAAFNHVISLDKDKKLIRVESGARWSDVQAAANSAGLAVKVMQASNIFTVGGSLSVNAHGRDPHYGSVIESVQSFRLLMANGEIKHVSRTENPELFQLAIGGYGLFGIILDVELSLTKNDIYKKSIAVIPRSAYPQYFAKNVQNNSEVGLHFAWPSIVRAHLFDEILVADYVKTDKYPNDIYELHHERLIAPNRLVFSLSRRFDWAKSLRWWLQKEFIGTHEALVSRNNAMRPEVLFLENQSERHTDILQEYFFPIDQYAAFLEGLKEVILNDNVNLLSMTLRFVPAAAEPALRYSRSHPQFAAVLYLNQGLDPIEIKKAQGWTQKIVDLSLSLGGSYYLPYQRYATREQIRRAYPQLENVIERKKHFDPTELFSNQFYRYYQ